MATPNQVLAEFEKQLRKKFSVKFITAADLKRSEEDMWKAGNPLAAAPALRRIWATGGTLYEKWDNKKIGLDKMNMDSLEVAVSKVLQAKGF